MLGSHGIGGVWERVPILAIALLPFWRVLERARGSGGEEGSRRNLVGPRWHGVGDFVQTLAVDQGAARGYRDQEESHCLGRSAGWLQGRGAVMCVRCWGWERVGEGGCSEGARVMAGGCSENVFILYLLPRYLFKR